MTVLTQWHKFLEAVANGKVGMGRTPIPSKILGNSWYEAIHEATKAPKLIIDPDLYSVMEPQMVADSMKAMIECNVVKLPFDPVLVECTFHDTLPDERFFLFMRGENALLFSILKDMAVVHPVRARVKHIMTEGQPGMDVFTDWDFPDVVPAKTLMDQQETYDRMCHWIARVIQRLSSIAYVVTNIQGIERAEVESPERLNRKREKSNKPPVPSYTVLRIGHVYKRDGDKVKYIPGGSVRQVHMRRGHTRRQRFGTGLVETKLIYIEPVLVNYRGDDPPQIKVKW